MKKVTCIVRSHHTRSSSPIRVFLIVQFGSDGREGEREGGSGQADLGYCEKGCEGGLSSGTGIWQSESKRRRAGPRDGDHRGTEAQRHRGTEDRHVHVP